MKSNVFKYTAAVACMFMIACAGTMNLYFNASIQDVNAQAKKVKPVLWKIPLGPESIQEMRLLSPGKLFVALKRTDSAISNKDYLLVDTDTGKVLWRYSREEKGAYSTVLATGKIILFAAERGKSTTLTAIGTGEGKVLWTLSSNSSAPVYFPFPEDRLLIAVERDAARVKLSAHDLNSGMAVWSRDFRVKDSDRLPMPVVVQNGIVHFYGGTEMLSVRDGKTVWERDDLRLSPKSPPAQLLEGSLVLIDEAATLHVINANSGKGRVTAGLEKGIDFTNISPFRDMIYLRGTAGEQDPRRYKIIALRSSDGRSVWSYADSEPSVSNLVEENNRLFFGTPTTLVALNLSDGKQLFRAVASSTGRSYPVHIRPVRDKIVFISEVMIAAFDPVTGKKQYSQGVTPIADLEGLDRLIKMSQNALAGRSAQGNGSSLSNWNSQEAARYQNLSRQSYQRNDNLQGRMQSDSSKFHSQLAFQFAMMDLGASLGEMAKAAAIQNELATELFLRSVILSAYDAAEEADYVFRPNKKDEFAGVSIVHLPTGEKRHFNLSPAYEDYGIWNLIDFKKGVIYHHGLGLDPADYSFAEPFLKHMTVRVQKYNSFLIAQPVDIPK
jgi:outer membrane protein assembly factor BamB